MDFAGNIPKEIDYFNPSMYGGGAGIPAIPIPFPYEELPYDDDTLDKWAEEHDLSSELQFIRAISAICDGADYWIEGIGWLLVPLPTPFDDLYGMALTSYGIYTASDGIKELVLWCLDWLGLK